eukprot:28933_1
MQNQQIMAHNANMNQSQNNAIHTNDNTNMNQQFITAQLQQQPQFTVSSGGQIQQSQPQIIVAGVNNINTQPQMNVLQNNQLQQQYAHYAKMLQNYGVMLQQNPSL